MKISTTHKILFFLVFLNLNANAQLWTWMNGGNGTNTISSMSAVYGTLGITTATNFPGTKSSGGAWQDASGNFWVFGGSGSFLTSLGLSNDLWKYNPTTNLWTWMLGSNLADQAGTYGTQGVSANANMPGARSSCCSWVDLSGNFWLFGGGGLGASTSGLLNDLWKFNPGTNQWTWIKGSSGVDQAGLYGTQGIPTATTCPGGRSCTTNWVDAAGDLWLFGGDGYGSNGNASYLNDVWKFNISSSQWTWMGGSNTTFQAGSYGTQGTPSNTNIPGARNGCSVSKDASGMIWLFGGYGLSSVLANSMGYLNDLWKFNPSTNQWTWVRGSNGLNQLATYGSLGVSSVSNSPGARAGGKIFPEINGNLYMFGGSGYATTGSVGLMNDLWRYTISNDTWTWVSGSNQFVQTGAYGTQGVSSTNNHPGARGVQGVWKDTSNNLWMFGGFGTVLSTTQAYVNEVWKYEICSTPTVPTNSTINSRLFICSGNTTTLTTVSDAPVSWYSSLTSSTSISSGSAITTPTLAAGNYTYYAESNLCNASTTRAAINVTVNATPTISVNSGSICYGNSFTIAPTGASVYSIQGNSAIITPVNTNTYMITGTSSAGCPASNTTVSTVTVNPTPSVSITGTNAICYGAVTNLTGNGANTYTWNNTTVSTSLAASPSSSTIYSLTGQNLFGCVNSTTVAVTVYSLPIISVNNGTICWGTTFTLNPSGATTYSYSSGSSTINPLVNSSYTITGSSIQGCASSNTVISNIVVNPLPTFTLSGNNNVCLGSSISLLVNGSPVSYTWSSGSNANLVVLNPTVNTVCSVTVTGSNGCKDSASKLITVNALPLVYANANNSVLCEGKSLLLNGSGAITYSWTGNVMNNTPFYPATSTMYTVTGTDGNGCKNSDVIFVVVKPSPTVTVSGNLNTICAGETITLTASGANSYSWNTNENTSGITNTPSVTLTFSVTGTGLNGCSKEISVTQQVSDCTGLKNEASIKKSILIYPNPSEGVFNIMLESVMEGLSVEVTNIFGEKILKQTLAELHSTINLESYPVGVYTISITKNNAIISVSSLVKY